jgi:hypothetical protein
MLRLVALFGALALVACASFQEPEMAREETVVKTFRARVEAVDQQTRVVTLVSDENEKLIFRADEGVRNLAQVKPGDVLVGELIENLLVEARPATAEELASPESITVAAAGAELGQKPAGLFVRQLKSVYTVAFIDREVGGGELRDAEGELHFVKVRDPSVLDRLKVGDNVVVTYTQALELEVVSEN